MKMKRFLVGSLVFVMMLSVIFGFSSCADKPIVENDTTFELVVRRYDGQDDNYSPNLTGEILGTLVVKVDAGQVTVSEALASIATKSDGVYKIYFNHTDYIQFIETTVGYSVSWYLNDGHFAKETQYVSEDYAYSYMAYNDHYSNGVTADFLDGLTVYTIVVDGWDGNIGTTASY